MSQHDTKKQHPPNVHTVACGVCRAARTPGHPSQCLASPATAPPQRSNRLMKPVILTAA